MATLDFLLQFIANNSIQISFGSIVICTLARYLLINEARKDSKVTKIKSWGIEIDKKQ